MEVSMKIACRYIALTLSFLSMGMATAAPPFLDNVPAESSPSTPSVVLPTVRTPADFIPNQIKQTQQSFYEALGIAEPSYAVSSISSGFQAPRTNSEWSDTGTISTHSGRHQRPARHALGCYPANAARPSRRAFQHIQAGSSRLRRRGSSRGSRRPSACHHVRLEQKGASPGNHRGNPGRQVVPSSVPAGLTTAR